MIIDPTCLDLTWFFQSNHENSSVKHRCKLTKNECLLETLKSTWSKGMVRKLCVFMIRTMMRRTSSHIKKHRNMCQTIKRQTVADQTHSKSKWPWNIYPDDSENCHDYHDSIHSPYIHILTIYKACEYPVEPQIPQQKPPDFWPIFETPLRLQSLAVVAQTSVSLRSRWNQIHTIWRHLKCRW